MSTARLRTEIEILAAKSLETRRDTVVFVEGGGTSTPKGRS